MVTINTRRLTVHDAARALVHTRTEPPVDRQYWLDYYRRLRSSLIERIDPRDRSQRPDELDSLRHFAERLLTNGLNCLPRYDDPRHPAGATGPVDEALQHSLQTLRVARESLSYAVADYIVEILTTHDPGIERVAIDTIKLELRDFVIQPPSWEWPTR